MYLDFWRLLPCTRKKNCWRPPNVDQGTSIEEQVFIRVYYLLHKSASVSVSTCFVFISCSENHGIVEPRTLNHRRWNWIQIYGLYFRRNLLRCCVDNFIWILRIKKLIWFFLMSLSFVYAIFHKVLYTCNRCIFFLLSMCNRREIGANCCPI